MSYVPDAGDIVWLDFTPQAGREQAGRRPALVLSPVRYNQITGLMLCCPLTTQIKGYPFEVEIPGDVPSVALSDQLRSLDWRIRRAEKKGRANVKVMADVRGKVKALLGFK